VIETVTEADLTDLLPLMRGYCDFYEVDPSDDALLAMSRELIADPHKDGLQLIARADDGRAVGFATIFWTWSTLSASRIAVMNDIFVTADARGSGAAERLIEACADRCRRRGITELDWQTAHDNLRAQKLYDRVGARRDERWLDYSLAVSPGAISPDS
jgi:GNAT superfamily N-acetyltransferase